MTTRITLATEATQTTEALQSLHASQTTRPASFSHSTRSFRAVAAMASVVISVTLIGGVIFGFGARADAASELAQAAQPATRS